MNDFTGKILLFFTLALILAARVYILLRQLWTLPGKNGPGYFLGVGVPQSFYSGPGVEWLRRYRRMLLLEHFAEAVFLAAILALRRWDWIPLTALGAVTLTAAMFGFTLYARRALGARPGECPTVGVSLVPRRLGDYLSWPAEALVCAIVACSWFLLLAYGDEGIRWREAVVETWVILGLLPGKIVLVRSSFPLPAERTREHANFEDAQRRYGLRVMDALGWFLTAILFVYSLQHAWPAVQSLAWLSGTLAGAVLLLGLYMTIAIVRGQGRLLSMSRGLRPAGSWSAPFRGAQWVSRSGLAWFVVWFGGMLVLFAVLEGS